jgi:hypothetical protein
LSRPVSIAVKSAGGFSLRQAFACYISPMRSTRMTDEAATGYFAALPWADLWDPTNPPLFHDLTHLVADAPKFQRRNACSTCSELTPNRQSRADPHTQLVTVSFYLRLSGRCGRTSLGGNLGSCRRSGTTRQSWRPLASSPVPNRRAIAGCSMPPPGVVLGQATLRFAAAGLAAVSPEGSALGPTNRVMRP